MMCIHIYTHMCTHTCIYTWQIYIVNTTARGLKKGPAGGLTLGTLELKESNFEGGIQGKYFASVTYIF